MIDLEQYELLDFGNDRKLERLGGVVLDRPCPAAKGRVMVPDSWHSADGYFHRKEESGSWQADPQLPTSWLFHHDKITMDLRPTDFGHVGLFPEQAANWQWITKRVAGRSEVRVLNLFAYTGGSSLAAAKAGAEVVHIDAAKSVVSWARKNAELSGLAEAPIRWIVEDAVKFVKRELKRGSTYDAIILDPPSYGHGPKGESWKISRDLVELLGDCRKLLSKQPSFFLLSCHTPGFGAAELSAMVSECLFGSCAAGVRTRDLALRTISGRKLPAGHAAYWP